MSALLTPFQTMVNSFTSILRGHPSGPGQPTGNYQTLPSSELDNDDGDGAEPDAGLIAAVGVDTDGRDTTGHAATEGHDPATYLSFWILGAGTVLGWSALISTFPFLTSLYPPTSTVGQNIPSLLSTIYCLGQLFFLGTAQSAVGKRSPTPRLRWSLLLLLLTFILTTFPFLSLILPFLSSTDASSLITILILLITLSLNFSAAYFQSSVLALASLWGSTEVLASMSGQAGVAVLISLAQVGLAIIGALQGQPTLPSGVDILDAVTYRAQLDGNGNGDASHVDDSNQVSTLAAVGLWALGSLGVGLCMLAFRYLRNHPTYDLIANQAGSSSSLDSSTASRSKSHGSERGSWKRTKKVLSRNRLLYAAVGLDFAVTLAVFPAITSLIISTNIPAPRLLKPDVFIPLHFLLFNIGDYVGRTYLPSFPPFLITSPPRVLLLSLSRVIFIPLFLACNLSTQVSSPLVNSDMVYFFILVMFGASNGYLGSMSIIVSSTPALNPKLDEDEKDIAGTLGVFCLMAGLSAGSMASFGVNWAVRA